MFQKSQCQSCSFLELSGTTTAHSLGSLGDDALWNEDLDVGLERCTFPAEDPATESAVVSSFEGPKRNTTSVAL